MAQFNYKRRSTMAISGSTLTPRVYSYDGMTANVNGDTNVLTVANVKALATWAPTANAKEAVHFKKGDLMLIQCTDGALPVQITAVDTETGFAALSWLNGTAPA